MAPRCSRASPCQRGCWLGTRRRIVMLPSLAAPASPFFKDVQARMPAGQTFGLAPLSPLRRGNIGGLQWRNRDPLPQKSAASPLARGTKEPSSGRASCRQGCLHYKSRAAVLRQTPRIAGGAARKFRAAVPSECACRFVWSRCRNAPASFEPI